MTPQEARRLIHYSGWASRKLLDAAQELTPEQRNADTGISHRSIASTIAHIYLADRIWHQRIQGVDQPLNWKSTLEDVEADIAQLQSAREAWIDQAEDAELDRVVAYKSILVTGEHSNTVAEIITHVVNHATLHRGQIMGMIRQLGIAPPPTDFILYLRAVQAS
jgi:uncharacterized damage-inducible protein DinB